MQQAATYPQSPAQLRARKPSGSGRDTPLPHAAARLGNAAGEGMPPELLVSIVAAVFLALLGCTVLLIYATR